MDNKETKKSVGTAKPAVAKATSEKKSVAKSVGEKKTVVKVDAKPVSKVVAEKKSTTQVKKSVIAKPAEEKVVAPTKKAALKKEIIVKEKKHVLYACSEATPFAGTGGLGEVMGSLPLAINKNSEIEARVILPLYECFPDEERQKLKFITSVTVPLAWRNQYCGLFEYNYNGTIFYFIDNEYYFKRCNLYGYYDDGERFAFFSRAVNELLPLLGWKVDILHAQDWQTALVPIYFKLFYMFRFGYEDIKTIFTIHNIEYQGKFDPAIIEDIFGIPHSDYLSLEYGGCINLMKGAIDYADAVSTVSPTYADEICDSYFAHGLDPITNKNKHKIRGILNGVDTAIYNPKTNPALFENYDAGSIAKKVKNKTELQKMLSLPVNENVPMIVLITRLATHKGLDILKEGLNDILHNDIQLVILGKGDTNYENYFSAMQITYPGKLSSIIAFNKDLSHKLYAAADMFLMPSKSEPCGLSQMMACRYGTIPIVRNTGGLRDSIIDCEDGDTGNGYKFDEYNAGSMLHAINRAIGLYRDYKDKWEGLRKRAIESEFSWDASAKQYIDFYNNL